MILTTLLSDAKTISVSEENRNCDKGFLMIQKNSKCRRVICKQIAKILLKHGREKIPNWECLFVHRGKGLFLSVYVDDIKLTGKKQNIDPMWKPLNKEVDLGEPTSFMDHVYLGCT